MKLDIHTQDRFGITQDVLLVISKRGWELLSMEMQPCHIFIHLSTQEEAFLEVEATLADVTGVRAVIPISFLPNERRSHYLDSLFTTPTIPPLREMMATIPPINIENIMIAPCPQSAKESIIKRSTLLKSAKGNFVNANP